MFKNEDDFKTIVNRLNIDDKPNPGHRESLRGQMLSAFDKSGEQSKTESRPLWRTIMKSPISKLAAAAGIIIAVLIGIHQFGGSIDGATVALAQVAENVKKVPWMHMIGSFNEAGRETKGETWASFESQIVINRMADGKVTFSDYAKNRKYVYDPGTDTVTVSHLNGKEFAMGAHSPVGLIERWMEQDKERLIRHKREGNLEIYEFDLSENNYTIYKVKLTVDAQTKLPIKIVHKGRTVHTSYTTDATIDFEYPENGPGSIYELGVPESAIVKTTDESKQYASDTAAPKLVPIDIELPRPMFVGTPQDVNKVEYLEKPLGKPRPPFYAPIGTKNAAFGKPVTSTDEFPIIGKLEWITDGDKEGSEGSFVELGPFEQHVTIDLEAEYNIYAILVWHYHKEAHVYFDVVVQAADDPDFTANVTTVFNNDIDNSLGLGVGKDMHYTETAEGKLIDAKGARARYVRLHSKGSTSNDLNHYIEVEVYGKPAK